MADTGASGNVICEDLAAFQDTLNQMRLLDDRVVYALNTSIPTQSFADQIDPSQKCKQLYQELVEARREREGIIKTCITHTSNKVSGLREEKLKDPDNIKAIANLRREQNTLRLMQSELNVEEVIRGRTNKIFHERCRNHYTPPTDSQS